MLAWLLYRSGLIVSDRLLAAIRRDRCHKAANYCVSTSDQWNLAHRGGSIGHKAVPRQVTIESSVDSVDVDNLLVVPITPLVLCRCQSLIDGTTNWPNIIIIMFNVVVTTNSHDNHMVRSLPWFIIRRAQYLHRADEGDKKVLMFKTSTGRNW